MRQIGHLPTESGARTFGDFLFAQGIENQVENDQPTGWVIWVVDEDRLNEAAEKLTEFRANPDDAKYKASAAKAAPLRAKKEKEAAAWNKRLKDRRHLFRPLTPYGVGPLTLFLIFISVAVFFISDSGRQPGSISKLYISFFVDSKFEELRRGEIWRLVTPIFIHMGFMHIFFNMWCLWDFGSMVEGRQSTVQLLLLVLGISIASNLAQYVLRGPYFGGMSGVNFGLLAYIWIRGKLDPGSGLFVHPTTLMFMMFWFFLGLFGAIKGIANIVHAVGFAVGAAWGWLSSLKYR